MGDARFAAVLQLQLPISEMFGPHTIQFPALVHLLGDLPVYAAANQ